MGNIDKNIIQLKEFNSLDLQRVQREIIQLTTTKTFYKYITVKHK